MTSQNTHSKGAETIKRSVHCATAFSQKNLSHGGKYPPVSGSNVVMLPIAFKRALAEEALSAGPYMGHSVIHSRRSLALNATAMSAFGPRAGAEPRVRPHYCR